MNQRIPSVYAATVTVVLTMIAALLSAVLLLLTHTSYTKETDAPVGCLNTASIHNFVLVLSCDLLQDVLSATVQTMLVAASLDL